MLSNLVLLASALPAMVAAAVVPPALAGNSIEVPDSLDKRQDNKCSAYKFMSMGNMVYKNEAAISARVSWKTSGSGWTDLTSPIIYVGESYTFRYESQLAIIPKDTNFQLRVCDHTPVIGGTCLGVAGTFQIPSPGKPTWTARVTTKTLDPIRIQNQCAVE